MEAHWGARGPYRKPYQEAMQGAPAAACRSLSPPPARGEPGRRGPRIAGMYIASRATVGPAFAHLEAMMQIPNSVRAAARTALVIAAAAGSLGLLSGCASTSGGRTEGPTVPIDLVVQNNLLRPTDLTIYAVTWDGHRTLLGSVPPRTTRTFSFKPVSFAERYRILATRITGRDIRSQVFTVGSDMTGQITWTMIPNIVGFKGTDPDTSGI